MTLELAYEPGIWVAALLVLAGCWPLAQAFRHDKLHPLAAYLLFTSVLAVVSAALFQALLWAGATLLGMAGLQTVGTAFVIILVSLVPGFLAARWVVGRPQVRRMPK